MKQLTTLFLVCFFIVATPCKGADVHFVWSDFVLRTEVMAGKVVHIKPLSTPKASSIGIIASDRRSYTNDASASFWASNMTEGVYEIQHTGPYTDTKLWISVPDTNSAFLAKDLIVAPTNLPSGGSVAWPTTTSDERFLRVDTNRNVVSPTNFLPFNIVAGTNIFIEFMGSNRIRINFTTVAPGGGGPTEGGIGLLTQGGASITTQGGLAIGTQ